MKPALCRHQQGAVTLIGALFLIVVIIVLLGAVQRMAATGITDSALQNDAVEALFLAETGIERAAWRYANASTCNLIPLESDNAGRGSFRIQSAVLAGTLCRVRVEGTVVTTTAANTVRRTVEADFFKAAFSGWAVGDVSGGVAVLLGWNGSSWVQTGPWAGVPAANLNSIYCVTADDCWAVGQNSGGDTILHWDGTAWNRMGPYAAVPNRDLHSVFCIATDDCWAVGQKNGNSNNINHWDGSSWSNVSAPGVPDVDLNSVFCIAGNDCWAVGQKDGNSNNINHWDGSSWSNVSAPGVPDVDLNSVHCAAGDDCRAVGDKNGNSENINHWNGSSWSNVTSPAVPDKGLNGVYCVAANDCWTVGVKSGGETIDHWNGSAWSRAGPYASVADQDLYAVSMVSATEGYAVGSNGTIAAWDGSNWNGQTSPVGTGLRSVSVIGGSSGSSAVTLVKWTEVIQ